MGGIFCRCLDYMPCTHHEFLSLRLVPHLKGPAYVPQEDLGPWHRTVQETSLFVDELGNTSKALTMASRGSLPLHATTGLVYPNMRPRGQPGCGNFFSWGNWIWRQIWVAFRRCSVQGLVIYTPRNPSPQVKATTVSEDYLEMVLSSVGPSQLAQHRPSTYY